MIQKDMEKKQQNMTTLNHLDLTEIKIVEKKKTRYLGLVDISQTNSMEEIIDQSVIGAKKYHLHRLYNASYGSMLSVENIYRGNYDRYAALYVELPTQLSEQALHLQPAGNYLRAFCRGNRDKLACRYRKILTYANKHGITFCDFAYEKGINELFIDSFDDYITQIEIPIKT